MSRLVGAGAILVLGVSVACAKRPPEEPSSIPRGQSTYRVLAEAEVTAGAVEPSAETITAIPPFAENGLHPIPTPLCGAAAVTEWCRYACMSESMAAFLRCDGFPDVR